MKSKAWIILIMVITGVALFAGTLNSADLYGNREPRILIAMRTIGHQMLLHSGDSVSRVLPVTKIDDHTFSINFESEFAFSPDTLARVVQQTFMSYGIPLPYTVQVVRCNTQAMVYGYEMNTANSAIPCVGRVQPASCYSIQITLPATFDRSGFLMVIGFGSIALISVVAFNFSRFRRPVLKNGVAVGNYIFYPDDSVLMYKKDKQELSPKELTILKVFLKSPNQVIDRDVLLKEGWENSGVITGRSLDMFVSKLRKKFQYDPDVKFINIHGRGYKLEL